MRRTHNQVMNFAPAAPDASFGVAGYERRYTASQQDEPWRQP